MAELGKPGATTDIVGVMVFGGDYPEYAEQRRRTRYAVVSALSTASFVPEQPEGLGFIMPSAGLERQRRVPFRVVPPGGLGPSRAPALGGREQPRRASSGEPARDFTRQLAVLSRDDRVDGVLILGPSPPARSRG
jgi:hypothetical protein